jgi:hypothetical protein
LEVWAEQCRGDLLAAILTVARGWVVAGRPSETARSDSYATWVSGLRGLLGWAGFPGVFGGNNNEAVLSSDDEEWRSFLVALHDAFGVEPFTVKDLVGTLSDFGGIDAAVLPGDLAHEWSRIYDGRDQGFRKRLGWWLKNRVGRYAGEWSLVVAGEDGHTKAPRYAVKLATQGAKAGGLRGLRGFRGFDPATERSSQSSNGDETGGAARPAENPRNTANPATDHCQSCGKRLWPDGSCSGCRSA